MEKIILYFCNVILSITNDKKCNVLEFLIVTNIVVTQKLKLKILIKYLIPIFVVLFKTLIYYYIKLLYIILNFLYHFYYFNFILHITKNI